MIQSLHAASPGGERHPRAWDVHRERGLTAHWSRGFLVCHDVCFTKHMRETAPFRALLRAFECNFMRALPLVHPILDVGCGDGHFASVTYDEPIDVGLDVSDRDLAEAAARRPAVYRDVVQASATAMPFPDGAFRTVVSNSTLEHIPDIDGALGEIARVLQIGGTFATTLPSHHFPEFLMGTTLARRIGLAGVARGYSALYNRISLHYHVDSPEVWRARFAAVGLDVVEHAYYFSSAAHRAFDLANYLGGPTLLTKRLLGRWVLHPLQAKPFEWWLRGYYEEALPTAGAYQFARCVKRP
jgi:SAM-dependent methyltransferase